MKKRRERMKVCVCGSRDFTDYEKALPIIYGFFYTFLEGWKVKGEIVSGCARGADALGERFAKSHGLKCHRFPADWEKYGKSAGYIRNKEMAEFSDVIIAFWDGKSKGTKHMIDICEKMNKKVYVINV